MCKTERSSLYLSLNLIDDEEPVSVAKPENLQTSSQLSEVKELKHPANKEGTLRYSNSTNVKRNVPRVRNKLKKVAHPHESNDYKHRYVEY